MADNQPALGQEVQVATGVALTVQLAPKTIRMYYLTEDQFENIATLNLTTAVCLAFFGICIGGFISLYSTVRATDLMDASTHATFIALTVLTGVLGIFFGALFAIGFVRSLLNLRQAKRTETVKTVLPS